jgi:hypothetical protein
MAELGVAAAAAAFLVACSPHGEPIEGALPSQPPFLPTATIQDLMDSEIDPAADFIWGSVGTIVTAAGVEEHSS